MRQRRLWGVVGLIVLALAALPAQARQARQIQFGQWTAGSDIVFDYRLTDMDGVERRLGFRLAKAEIDDGRKLIRAYDDQEVAALVERAQRDYLSREAPDVTASFVRKDNGVGVSLSGSDEKRLKQVLASLNDIHRRVADDYARRLYLREDGRVVFPDYMRLAERYTAPLKPLAQAIAGAVGPAGAAGDNERARLALALTFFQTIPYDALTDRDVNNGIDFIAPPVLLDLNRGDCDSKAVALGAVLRSLLPNRKLIIVLLPRHAIVGIDLPARPGERSLVFEGRTYVLMETAGPGSFAPGALFSDSEAHIKARRIDRVMPL